MIHVKAKNPVINKTSISNQTHKQKRESQKTKCSVGQVVDWTFGCQSLVLDWSRRARKKVNSLRRNPLLTFLEDVPGVIATPDKKKGESSED